MVKVDQNYFRTILMSFGLWWTQAVFPTFQDSIIVTGWRCIETIFLTSSLICIFPSSAPLTGYAHKATMDSFPVKSH